MEEKHILFLDKKLHYNITGKGMPVIFIHGFAEESSIWEKQVDFLKQKYQLIVPDLPGSGKSEMNPTELYGMETFAKAIRQILSQEKIDKCIMLGHSMGGYICLAFTEAYPELLIAFGLIHSSAYADNEQKIESRKKSIEFIKSNGTDAFLKTMIPGLFLAQGNSLEVKTLLDKGKSFLPDSLIQYYQAMIVRPDRTEVLKNSTVPVIFLMGAHDKVVPIKDGLEQSHMPNHSYMHVLRNSAHMGMLEETELTNNILAGFLNDLPGYFK